MHVYVCMYVSTVLSNTWAQIRTNHERLVRLASEEEKDYPLMLQTTSQWQEKGPSFTLLESLLPPSSSYTTQHSFLLPPESPPLPLVSFFLLILSLFLFPSPPPPPPFLSPLLYQRSKCGTSSLSWFRSVLPPALQTPSQLIWTTSSLSVSPREPWPRRL